LSVCFNIQVTRQTNAPSIPYYRLLFKFYAPFFFSFFNDLEFFASVENFDWQVGVIVDRSGSGKTGNCQPTLSRSLYPRFRVQKQLRLKRLSRSA
jgi:hypothetical protein